MSMLFLYPTILQNSAELLEIEESHFGRVGIIISGLFLASLFIIPAFISGTVVGFIIALILGIVVVGVPFFVVLALSKYRRIVIRRGIDVECITNYTLFGQKTQRFAWDEIAHVIYQLRRDWNSRRIGRLRVSVVTVDGHRFQILRGWHSIEIRDLLRQQFDSKYEYQETLLPW